MKNHSKPTHNALRLKLFVAVGLDWYDTMLELWQHYPEKMVKAKQPTPEQLRERFPEMRFRDLARNEDFNRIRTGAEYLAEAGRNL